MTKLVILFCINARIISLLSIARQMAVNIILSEIMSVRTQPAVKLIKELDRRMHSALY